MPLTGLPLTGTAVWWHYSVGLMQWKSERRFVMYILQIAEDDS
jgi:hypothetical protein